MKRICHTIKIAFDRKHILCRTVLRIDLLLVVLGINFAYNENRLIDGLTVLRNALLIKRFSCDFDEAKDSSCDQTISVR